LKVPTSMTKAIAPINPKETNSRRLTTPAAY
jgi:hypothetical protein